MKFDSQIKSVDFMFEIGFNNKLPLFYACAFQSLYSECLLKSKSTSTPLFSSKIQLVYDIPSYLDVKKRKLSSSIGFKSVIQHSGYCIDLSGYDNVEEYIADRFSSNSRQRLRRRKKRLEMSFDISYKMYHGAIDKTHYYELFEQFYEMLKLRAQEKGIDNGNLKCWDIYTNNFYDMILNKQASLFVIYDKSEAINICLNMHVKNTVFLFITSYNIDYSNFRIGHTNWMVQLDWFIKNNIKTIDFHKGNVAYKKRWANKKYDFSYHIFYEKSSMAVRMKVFWLIKKLQLKQILRNRGINHIYYGILRKFKKNIGFKKKSDYIRLDRLPSKVDLLLVDLDRRDPYLIKRSIYNYLYLSSLNINEVDIYKETTNENTFYIASEKEVVMLLVNKS